MNRIFVFESKEKNKIKEAGKFVSSRIITLLMDMAIMAIGVSVLKFNDKIMKLFSQVVITISNYIFSKLFVFTKKVNNENPYAPKIYNLNNLASKCKIELSEEQKKILFLY